MRSRRALIALALAMLVAAGCGTRVREARNAQSATVPSAAASSSGGAAEATSSDGVGAGGSNSGTAVGATQSTVGQAAPAEPGASSAPGSKSSAVAGSGGAADTKAPAASGKSSGSAGGAAPTKAGQPPGGATSAPTAPSGAGGSAPPAPAAGGSKSTIVIGNVGTYSGPAGSSLTDLPEGVQVWAKWVNGRGGVNGHPVKLVTADDGADPARHRALVQQVVETQGAIALVANGETITGASSVDYLTKKGIPVIGNEGGTDWFYSSPTYFTHASTGETYWKAVASSVASVAKVKNKLKWASVTCTEATTCTDANRVWNNDGEIKGQGLEPVYSARASIAQPDYTAECLNARNAGAEVVTLVLDASSVKRFAASCARQGYRPIFTEVAASSKTEHASDPNLAGGLIASLGHFIWTQGGTPAIDEFQEAIKKYLGRTPGAGHAAAWSAAKIFEKAAAGLGEPPTAQGVLQGLWTFKGETLGGLVMPLTFTSGQPAARQICWATNYAENGKWIPFDGGRISCR